MYKLSEKLESKINSLPQVPGCYLYKDKDEKIIYVGKAIKLRNRVKSYFINYLRLDSKTQALIRNIADLDFLIVDNEAEALILETNLIKKYRPKFNRLKIDDKNYAWIKITNEDFPRIKIIRQPKFDKVGKTESKKDIYLGPYNGTFPIKEVLKRLRKIWNYRSCNRSISWTTSPTSSPKIRKGINGKVTCSNSKPCLYYYIGLCKAPCANKINKLDYQKNIDNLVKFLNGEKQKILDELTKEMNQAAKNLNFERASVFRDRLNNIKYALNQVKLNADIDDKLIEEVKTKEKGEALKELFSAINIELPKNKEIKIECYDISNIQGKFPVGAMTVMVNGRLRPDLYRKFKINTKQTPDDFEMHKEMIRRRFLASFSSFGGPKDPSEVAESRGGLKNNKLDDSWQLPDLIITDGGKGQVSAVQEVFKEFELGIPHFGLAKRFEEIILPVFENSEDLKNRNIVGFQTITLRRKSEALKLIQQIRDESHRFGITYHRKLRSKGFLKDVER